MSNRRALLARLHIARKEMALAEDSYRAILTRITGQGSAADCNDAQLLSVLDEFRRLGWSPATKKRRPSPVPHVRKIYALWSELKPRLNNGNDAALRAFCQRQTGVSRPEWLDGAQANKVIEGLKAWLTRLTAVDAA